MARRAGSPTLDPNGAAHILADRNIIDGIVAIGRNEGERLRFCLASLDGLARTLVYVDSGSTDGSVALARSAGAQVVQLDLSVPFTAARARNAGFERLLQTTPDAEFVQFIDGDCRLDPDWLAAGARVLRAEPDVSVVCGRRRELLPESSVYNRLCDVEWDTPVGETRACGGDALVRTREFRQVGGYDPGMIAGEEPDLCLRLRRRGTRILRIDAEMTLHDAAMTSWTQWWQRAVRTGHTTAELLAKYGPAPEHRRLRRALSALAWAVLLPCAWSALLAWALSTADATWIAAALVAPPLLYSRPFVRASRACRLAGRTRRDARAYALSCILAKAPETAGMLLYVAHRVARRRPHWIEYKQGPRGLAARAGEGRIAEPGEPGLVKAPDGSGLARRIRRRVPGFVKRGVRTGIDRAARMSGLLARRERSGAGGLTVLTYHRVLPRQACADYPYPALVMPLEAFRQQVAWLAAHGEVLPLSEALERHAQGAGRNLFALTFDDGYHDSGEIVAGVLEQAGVRGTFYVTTGFVGTDELLWFDRSALLFAAAAEPQRHEVVQRFCGDARRDERPRRGAEPAAWTGFLKGCELSERSAVLAALELAAGGPLQARRFRSMSVDQVVELHRSGHEVGSHTVSHTMLPQLDDAALRQELEDSRDALSSWIGQRAPGFCYPNGNHDGRSVAAVIAAGYAHACTVRNGVHRQGEDPFRIKRVEIAPGRVLDRSGRLDVTAFRRELCSLFRGSPASSPEGA